MDGCAATRHIPSTKVAAALELVGHRDVSKHSQANRVDGIGVSDQLQVGLHQGHHDRPNVLGDGELNFIEHRPGAAVGCDLEVVRTVAQKLVEHVIGS